MGLGLSPGLHKELRAERPHGVPRRIFCHGGFYFHVLSRALTPTGPSAAHPSREKAVPGAGKVLELPREETQPGCADGSWCAPPGRALAPKPASASPPNLPETPKPPQNLQNTLHSFQVLPRPTQSLQPLQNLSITSKTSLTPPKPLQDFQTSPKPPKCSTVPSKTSTTPPTLHNPSNLSKTFPKPLQIPFNIPNISKTPPASSKSLQNP